MKQILRAILLLLLLTNCKSNKYLEFTHNQRVEMEGGYYEVECLRTKSPYESKITVCLFNFDNHKPVYGATSINNIKVASNKHIFTTLVYPETRYAKGKLQKDINKTRFYINTLPKYPLFTQNTDYHLFIVNNLVLNQGDSLVFKVYSKEYSPILH